MDVRLPALLAVATLAAACDGKGGGGGAGQASASASSGQASAPAVEPRIDALARAVLACKAYESTFDMSCPGGVLRGADTCQVYSDNIDNPADDLAAEASNALAWFGQCASRFDALLDSEDRARGVGG